MTQQSSLAEKQGYYRYDPNGLTNKGSARLFPYTGQDGSTRYVLSKLYEIIRLQGRLSVPCSLLLTEIESSIAKLESKWQDLSTLLVDLRFLQSDWLNFDLPPNEQLNNDYVQEKRKFLLKIWIASAVAQVVNRNLPESDQIQQQRQLFLHSLAKSFVPTPLPAIAQIYERDGGLSDREFVRQRLAGANPMVIRRVQAVDAGLIQALASQTYKLANGNVIDLLKSAGENRLFIADYPLFKDLQVTDLQSGKYLGSPTAIFYRHERGLEPVLIELLKGRVVTPSITGNEADDWAKAKLYFQSADANHHELISHFCYTHAAMEAFAIATARQLPSNHPFSQLLSPHFRFLIAINYRANAVLLAPGSALDQLMAPTLETTLKLSHTAYRQKSFWYYSLLNDIELRGIEPQLLPDFPYRDDALLLWEAIAKYTTRYLQQYYSDDKAVIQDTYLQAWADELGAPLNTRPKSDFPQIPQWLPPEWITLSGINPQELPTHPRVPGFAKIGSLQQLIDIATILVFTCGPQHAAINFSQFDYMTYVPNAPLATYSHPNTTVSLDKLLPPLPKDLLQMQLTATSSGIRWGNLGSSDLIQFFDQSDRQILAQFQSDLRGIEGKIQVRNQQRFAEHNIDYPYLLPSRIPNSINI
jgi:arachidonate 15-lipoxygenase